VLLVPLCAVLLGFDGSVGQAAVLPEGVSGGWYLLETSRQDEAVAVASQRLAQAPDDLAAHDLFIRSWSYYSGEQALAVALAQEYRAWAAARGHDEVARLALARAISVGIPMRSRRTGLDAAEGCAEAETLLSPLPEDPGRRHLALVFRHDLHRWCQADVEGDLAALDALGEDYLPSRRHALMARLKAGPVDGPLLEELRVLTQDRDWTVRWGYEVWGTESSEPSHRAAQRLAVKMARRDARSGCAEQVYWACSALRRAQNKGWRLAWRRLVEADPESPYVIRLQRRTRLRSRVDRAHLRASPQASLDALDALADEMPDSGELRLHYDQCLASRLSELEQDERLIVVLAETAERNPEHVEILGSFAHLAAERGERFEEGLAAVDEALRIRGELFPPFLWNDWRHEGWLEREQKWQEWLLDSRAALLEQLGREQTGEFVSPAAFGPAFALEAGFRFHGDGADSESLAYLLYALTWGEELPDEQVTQAGELAEQLAPARRWLPAGVDVYREARRAARADHLAWVEATQDAIDPLIGQQMPDLRISVDGQVHELHSFEGPRVVKIWATNCGFCVVGMLELDEAAARYEGVTFLAVTARDSRERVDAFFEGAPPPSYRVAMLDEESEEDLPHRSMPATYLLDDEAKVLAVILGYSGDSDDRLEEALEQFWGE